jgi:UDP-glucuronate 4-epimerase
MIAILERLLGKAARIEHRPFQKTDMTETQADIGKASRLLAWHPQVVFPDGLERTVRWYRDNHDWVQHIRV